jgi:geranylgeranyl reductase family protein
VERFDVAIVGTGPAGSTAAHRLAAAGLKVLLLEKAAIPRYKTCGGGVVGRARPWLAVPIDRAVEHECRRAEIHLLDAGLRVAAERDAPLVSMTMRSTLDALLTDGAVSAGAVLRTTTRVTSLEANGTEVLCRTDGPVGTVSATFVVAADGATGVAARAAGWAANPAAVPALECEMTVPERVHARFAGAARFDFGSVPHGYGWVFPKQDRLSVGVLTTHRGRTGLDDRLAEYLDRLGINEVQAIERHGYVIPLRPVSGPLVRGRTMLVGDAAGFADPITAEGISGAALSAELAVRALVTSGGDESRVRHSYEQAVAREIAPELQSARFYARILYGLPRLRAFVFRRAGQSLVEAIADVMAGTRTYRDVLGGPLRFVRLLAHTAW